MNRTIEIRIARAEGAIVRTLGLIERRGFVVESVATEPEPLAESLLLRIEVASRGRPFDVLLRQIARLVDVRRALLVEPLPAGQRLVC